MNERIKELYDQCFDYSATPNIEFKLEKFAESIVKECMEHSLEIGRLNPGPETEMTCRAVADRISIKMLGVYPPPGPIKAPERAE